MKHLIQLIQLSEKQQKAHTCELPSIRTTKTLETRRKKENNRTEPKVVCSTEAIFASKILSRFFRRRRLHRRPRRLLSCLWHVYFFSLHGPHGVHTAWHKWQKWSEIIFRKLFHHLHRMRVSPCGCHQPISFLKCFTRQRKRRWTRRSRSALNKWNTKWRGEWLSLH